MNKETVVKTMYGRKVVIQDDYEPSALDLNDLDYAASLVTDSVPGNGTIGMIFVTPDEQNKGETYSVTFKFSPKGLRKRETPPPIPEG